MAFFGLPKRVVLQGIAHGASLPEAPIDRILELTHLKRFIALLGINCVLDVGANKGQFASELRGIGFKGLIASFEPLQREFSALSAAFSSDRNWRGFRMALGDAGGRATLNVIPNLTVMSSLLEPVPKWRNVVGEDVEVRRLDDLFGSVIGDLATPRVLLKMDTQGYDLNVFAGAAGCLSAIHALQSELSVVPLYRGMPHYLKALEAYECEGFELFNLSTVSRVEQGGVQELNCLMRRR